MSFFSEIAVAAGLSELKLSQGYSVINYNGETVYLEGVVRLLSVEEETIKLQLRGAAVTLLGSNLNIKELSDTVIVCGEIKTMEFVKTKNIRGQKNEKK